MIFRILDSVRKHHLSLRYAGRHLLWTAPALYGYYNLYGRLAESYSTGYIGVARGIAVGTQGTVRQYLAEQKEQKQQQQQQQQQQQDGSCCHATQAKEQQEAKAKLENKEMLVVHGISACNI
ncbi:hypothetical protein PG985_011025 [Apiospora marii]|uniref:Uncharacterized protein n=1 Tax=Apiospora marii TaxID=335849 RepID=A0ABR1SUU0_9PEZI